MHFPPVALDFSELGRLRLLLLSREGKPPVIRLLNARRLFKLVLEDGTIYNRKHLEQQHNDVFCTGEFVENLLDDLILQEERQERFLQFPGIVALSYSRQCAELRSILGVLEWWMSERAQLIVRAGREPACRTDPLVQTGDAPCDANFGIFIDKMSLYESPSSLSEEEDLFKVARDNLCIIFGHKLLALWSVTKTPTEEPESQYARRGWCMMEKRLASLVKPTYWTFDVSSFDRRQSHDDFKGYRCTPSDRFGTEHGVNKTVEQLAAQSDQKFVLGKSPTFSVMTPNRRRGMAVIDHTLFAQQLTTMAWTDPADVSVCANIYARAAQPLLQHSLKQLELGWLGCDVEEYRLLGASLGSCLCLESLCWRECWTVHDDPRLPLGARAAEAFFGAATATHALTALDLGGNLEFGKGGSAALNKALQRDAFPGLETLHVNSCRVTAVLFKGLGARALTALTELRLSSNESFGTEGCKALATAVSDGAMPRLEKLFLSRCGVTAALFAGMKGGLPALTELRLDYNMLGDAGCVELASAIERGAMTPLKGLWLQRCGISSKGLAVLPLKKQGIEVHGLDELRGGCQCVTS